MHFLKYILLIIVLGTLSKVSAQNYRQGSCGNNSYSHLYITPYIGLGGGQYSYNLNNTVMDTDSIFYNQEKGGMFTPLVGINFMYKVGKGNLGGGTEIQGAMGVTNNELFSTKQNIYLFKFYGRYEYALYTDAFNDFGIHIEGGLLFPRNVFGNSPTMGAYGKTGFFYNYIISSTSSLFLSLDYSYSTFNSEIGGGLSRHKLENLEINIGYRFWFK